MTNRGAAAALVALAIIAPVARGSGPEAPPPPGDFVSDYQKPATADYDIYYEELLRRGFLQSVTAELNRVLRLPTPLTLRTAECGHSTTTYSAETHVVTVCYEFLDAVLAIAGEAAPVRAHAEQLFSGAVTFALLREVGEAITGMYALPAPQGAGVAGDEFAAITLAAAERNGDPSAAAAVEFFDAALAEPDSGFEYLETHGFDRGRLETVACILYGNAPADHAAALERGTVPKARAPGCAEEVVAVATRWDRFLRPHMRESAPAPEAAPPAPARHLGSAATRRSGDRADA